MSSDEKSMWPVTVSEWIATQAVLKIVRTGTVEEATALEVTLGEFCAAIDFRRKEVAAD